MANPLFPAGQRPLALFIACSLDGYIAGPGGDMSFLDAAQQGGEDYGYESFIKEVDTVLVGRKTYEWVMTQVPVFPHAGKETYVITHRPGPASEKLQFYSGDVHPLVQELKSRPGGRIFCDGGASLIHQLLSGGWVDEITLFFIPVFLGGGTRLFQDGRPEQKWKLLHSRQYNSGVLECRLVKP